MFKSSWLSYTTTSFFYKSKMPIRRTTKYMSLLGEKIEAKLHKKMKLLLLPNLTILIPATHASMSFEHKL